MMSLTACKESKSPEPAEVKAPESSVFSGEMFIRTKGGDTVKLSGQEIRFYLEDTILEAVERSKESAAADAPSFDAQIQKWTKIQEDENKLMDESIKLTLSIDRELESMINESKAYLKGLKEAKNAWPHASYVFTHFPQAEYKTRTNSDAKFEITLPSGKWVAVAEASRQVGSDEEMYFWAVRLSPDRSSLLDNSNLVTADSDESVISLSLSHFKVK